MILSKHRDIPVRLMSAINNGLCREMLAQQMPTVPNALALREIDRVLEGKAVGFDMLRLVEDALDRLTAIPGTNGASTSPPHSSDGSTPAV